MSTKIKLYFLSITPLFLILLIQTLQFKLELKPNTIPLISITMLLIGIICYYSFKNELKGNTNNPVTITSIENIDYEHITFLVTYIIPFIGFDYSSIRSIIIIFLLLVFIGAIFVKTNIFFANPVLAVFGFHIYKVEITGRKDLVFISKDKLNINDKVFTNDLHDNVFYVKKDL